jgi:hypothetical protein
MEEKYCPQSLGALASAAFVKNRSKKNLMDIPISVISGYHPFETFFLNKMIDLI